MDSIDTTATAAVDLVERYRDAVDVLDENFAFFLTHVLNMGRPEFTPAVPTAGVVLPTDTTRAEDFKFLFNPGFAAQLTAPEFAFVLAHECLHVLLNHLDLVRSGTFADRRKFNLAADCVINDYLVSMGFEPGRLTQLAAFGEKVCGFDCANATVTEVYSAIPDQGDPDGDPDGESGENGDLGDFMRGRGEGEGFDSHDWMDQDGQAESDGGEKFCDQVYNDTERNEGIPEQIQEKREDGNGAAVGNPGGAPGSGVGGLRKWAQGQNVGLKWAELLRQINPDAFKGPGDKPKASWRRMPRKLAGVYGQFPDMGALPVREDKYDPKGQTPAIVMALDTSGSCARFANDFITLARSVPQNKIKLFPITFTTRTEKLDLDNPIYYTGGTEFGCIETHIRNVTMKELGHYPKAVVVITDGAARFHHVTVPAENESSWYWLLTDDGRWKLGDLPGQESLLKDFQR